MRLLTLALAPQTRNLPLRLCGELQDRLEVLRRGSGKARHVGFLGTTGAGKSFVLDMLLMLLSVSSEEYVNGLHAHRVRDGVTSEDTASAAASPGAVAWPQTDGSQLMEEEEAPASPLAPTPSALPLLPAVPQLATQRVSWQQECCALAGAWRRAFTSRSHAHVGMLRAVFSRVCCTGFLSSPAWPADDLTGAAAQEAHLAAWMKHNFVLRISAAGTGTCKFLQVRHEPVFSAEVKFRTPKELVLDLRRLHTYQLKCVARARAFCTAASRAAARSLCD